MIRLGGTVRLADARLLELEDSREPIFWCFPSSFFFTFDSPSLPGLNAYVGLFTPHLSYFEITHFWHAFSVSSTS